MATANPSRSKNCCCVHRKSLCIAQNKSSGTVGWRHEKGKMMVLIIKRPPTWSVAKPREAPRRLGGSLSPFHTGNTPDATLAHRRRSPLRSITFGSVRQRHGGRRQKSSQPRETRLAVSTSPTAAPARLRGLWDWQGWCRATSRCSWRRQTPHLSWAQLPMRSCLWREHPWRSPGCCRWRPARE